MTLPTETPSTPTIHRQEAKRAIAQRRVELWEALLTEAGLDVDPVFFADHVTWSPWVNENRFQEEPLPLGNGDEKLCVVGLDAKTYFSLRSGYRNMDISREEAVALLRSQKDHIERLTRDEQELAGLLHQPVEMPPLTQGKALSDLTVNDIVLVPSREGNGWELGRVRQIDHRRFTYQKANKEYREVHVYADQKLRVVDRSGKTHDPDTGAQYQQECHEFLTRWNANEAEITAMLNSTFTDEAAQQVLESSTVEEDDIVLVPTEAGRWVPARVYGVIGANVKLVTGEGYTLEARCELGQLVRVARRGPGSRGEQPVNPPGWVSGALGEHPTRHMERGHIRIQGGGPRRPHSHAD